ncbi:DUF5677 domain-containing protein [Paraburkholderia phymatum]|uniref:DUF5677 domain-containing protein n=1 Tax=Paraburkholderia phymatum TaxID=148447 RepID=A0ACC6UE23_9BURK
MEKFNEVGFLSNDLGSWIDQVRNVFKPEFAAAVRINRLAMEVLFSLPAEDMTEAHLTGNLCFARALQSFQTTILLSERGALADARTLVRSATETAIALANCRIDPTMPAQIAEDADLHRSKLAKSLLEANKSKNSLTEEKIAELGATVSEVAKLYGAKGPTKINWAQKASAAGMGDLYDIAYRTMSGDGAHCTVWSLGHHHSLNAGGNGPGFVFRPEREELDNVLFTACSVMLHALASVIDWFGLDPFAGEMSACVSDWKSMRTS